MSTQTTTAPGALATTMTIHEYRIERTSADRWRALLARIRRDRTALDQWQWQPVPPRPVNLQEQIARAQLRMSAR